MRERYAAAASSVGKGAPPVAALDGGRLEPCSCGCGDDVPDAAGRGFGAGLYGRRPDALPDAAKLASLGCGNPTAVAELHEGETVLDLGSGGGIDVLLSAAAGRARRARRTAST